MSSCRSRYLIAQRHCLLFLKSIPRDGKWDDFLAWLSQKWDFIVWSFSWGHRAAQRCRPARQLDQAWENLDKFKTHQCSISNTDSQIFVHLFKILLNPSYLSVMLMRRADWKEKRGFWLLVCPIDDIKIEKLTYYDWDLSTTPRSIPHCKISLYFYIELLSIDVHIPKPFDMQRIQRRIKVCRQNFFRQYTLTDSQTRQFFYYTPLVFMKI